MTISSGDTATIEYTGRLDDGTVFDTSREETAEESGLLDDQAGREYAPLTVEIGDGEIIEGLEDALVGMEAGEEATVEIPPEKAYGEPTEDALVEYDRDAFEEALQGETPEEGMRVQTQEGGLGEVVEVGPESVRIDFNHDLAGETLEFEVEVVEVR